MLSIPRRMRLYVFMWSLLLNGGLQNVHKSFVAVTVRYITVPIKLAKQKNKRSTYIAVNIKRIQEIE